MRRDGMEIEIRIVKNSKKNGEDNREKKKEKWEMEVEKVVGVENVEEGRGIGKSGKIRDRKGKMKKIRSENEDWEKEDKLEKKDK